MAKNCYTKKSKRKAVPLAPPPHVTNMKSRKKARQVTTLFHKYTRERDLAIKQGASAEMVKQWDDKLRAIGGRETYQKASQLSTSFHSTSKWVLGCLQRRGWLHGIAVGSENDSSSKNESKVPPGVEEGVVVQDNNDEPTTTTTTETVSKRKRTIRRETRLLEIGSINTELLDAAERTMDEQSDKSMTEVEEQSKVAVTSSTATTTKKYRLNVRAIDLHSMHPGRIEEADFLKLTLDGTTQKTYDVVVCSMVLNCVTTPEDRGEMLARIYHFLQPGGLLFLTIPKLCLTQSPFVNRDQFLKLLGSTGVGFEVEETKESPKVVFFLCKRPDNVETRDPSEFHERWTKKTQQRTGKKYRNQFAVVLKKESVLREDLASLNN